ncbi:MAG: hypothetical protein MHMPM18_001702 [Marteilia pararefringens]
MKLSFGGQLLTILSLICTLSFSLLIFVNDDFKLFKPTFDIEGYTLLGASIFASIMLMVLYVCKDSGITLTTVVSLLIFVTSLIYIKDIEPFATTKKILHWSLGLLASVLALNSITFTEQNLSEKMKNKRVFLASNNPAAAGEAKQHSNSAAPQGLDNMF